MKREVPIEDLRKLYTANDLARTGCQNCQGCFDCCCGMGESIILDPFDVWRLTDGLQMNFASLMEHLELHPVDGVILPNLKMSEEQDCCTFLNEEGRCSIHPYRPGLCRLFPLGRYYENGSFRYFLQQSECRMEPKTKVRVSKWIDTPDVKAYEAFVLTWHNFLEQVQMLLDEQQDEQLSRDLNVHLLNTFYATPYERQADFYSQFETRMAQMQKLLKILKHD
ncbi:MAG: YkgJ family cysteine cluster protein [Marvinbryantia sp.]